MDPNPLGQLRTPFSPGPRLIQHNEYTEKFVKSLFGNEYEITPDKVEKEFKPGFYRQMEAFVNMVNTGTLEPPGMDLEDAYKTMLLAERFVHA